MVFAFAVYELVPLVINVWFGKLITALQVSGNPSWFVRLLSQISEINVIHQLGVALATGYGESVMSTQFVSNCCIGIGFFFAAAILFSWSPSRFMSSTKVAATNRYEKWSRSLHGRPGSDPFRWKDFHFVGGGYPFLALRIIFHLTLYFVVMSAPTDSMSRYMAYIQLSTMAITIDAAIMLSKSISDELRNQTWSVTMLIPRDYRATLYRKFAGAIIGWLPGFAIQMCCIFCSEHAKDFSGLSTIMGMLMISHLAMSMATFVRWGMVPLAYAIVIALDICMRIVMANPTVAQHYHDLVDFTTTFIVVAVCHIVTIRRMKMLAAR